MSIVKDLRALPLFQGMSEARLDELVRAFRSVSLEAGTVLFRPGDKATTFDLLVRGEVTVTEEPTSTEVPPVSIVIKPLAPVGELGSLTGLPRSTTATATTEIELLSVRVGDLLGFFDAHGEIGLAFYKNLLGIVTDKVRRDRSRIEDMRTNIVRTQKAMKELRETVLAAQETPISKPVFETLDTLIQSNRRANYRVSPTKSYPAHVRLDDGTTLRVLEVSEGSLKLEARAFELARDPSFWAGVLVVPTGEVLLSGTVARDGDGSTVIQLDKTMDEYKTTLADYMTRLQLLDFVV